VNKATVILASEEQVTYSVEHGRAHFLEKQDALGMVHGLLVVAAEWDCGWEGR